MIKKISYSLVLLSSILFLASCASMKLKPVLNYTNQPVTQGSTTAQVKKCILLAGAKRHWHMKQVKSGLISAEINVRAHYAAADIRYTNKSYSITYKTSHHMHAADGMIHRNYNRWIANLNKEIQHCLRAKVVQNLCK